MQYVAVCCIVSQCIAVCCSVVQCVAHMSQVTHTNDTAPESKRVLSSKFLLALHVLQCALHVLQCALRYVAECCSVLQCAAVSFVDGRVDCTACIAACCSVVQCVLWRVAIVAVCCSVLQCVACTAVCCSVPQCVTVCVAVCRSVFCLSADFVLAPRALQCVAV